MTDTTPPLDLDAIELKAKLASVNPLWAKEYGLGDLIDIARENVPALCARVRELEITGKKDYNGMRDMQAKFIKSDHLRRELEERLKLAEAQINELLEAEKGPSAILRLELANSIAENDELRERLQLAEAVCSQVSISDLDCNENSLTGAHIDPCDNCSLREALEAWRAAREGK